NVTRFHKRIADELNRIVYAVSDQHLLRRNPEIARQDRPALLVFGIARQEVSIQGAAQGTHDRGRTAHGILIEIEPQLAFPPLGRRAIFLQTLHSLARLNLQARSVPISHQSSNLVSTE